MAKNKEKYNLKNVHADRLTVGGTGYFFLLRCLEVGLSISDSDILTIGLVLDNWMEKGYDSVKYKAVDNVQEAAQKDFDLF